MNDSSDRPCSRTALSGASSRKIAIFIFIILALAALFIFALLSIPFRTVRHTDLVSGEPFLLRPKCRYNLYLLLTASSPEYSEIILKITKSDDTSITLTEHEADARGHYQDRAGRLYDSLTFVVEPSAFDGAPQSGNRNETVTATWTGSVSRAVLSEGCKSPLGERIFR